ncbi:MAG: homocysteine S-methyltransferase family protein [Candidatus Hydrogenedentota bacterium]|nr:MAG: homocysteine S-methyltransferase family protein [Candidatus Hydrogenedentota bacterium]
MNLLEKLRADETFVFDGAMGTMLQAHGLAIGECPEEWNTSHPDVVRQIHSSYFDVGCDIVETNSFGGTRLRLARFGLADKVRELNQKAVENARAVAGPGHHVAGSVGPTGEFIRPYGNLAYEEVLDAFREQVSALEEGGADIICVETMSDLNEARAAIEAARMSTKCVVFASMTFNHDKRGYRTMMGVDPKTAARTLEEYGADVIGANCGTGPEGMTEILKDMSEATSKSLLAKPNAGLPSLEGDKTVYHETPEGMAAKMRPLLDIGVKILGGCCGTTPEYLREIAKIMRKNEELS